MKPRIKLVSGGFSCNGFFDQDACGAFMKYEWFRLMYNSINYPKKYEDECANA